MDVRKRSAFLDHVKLRSADLADLAHVEHLTLWAVDLAEPHLLARLESLRALDWRGGNIAQLAQIAECKQLVKLAVSHNRAIRSLDFLRPLESLKGLSLYALPHISDLTPLLQLRNLKRLDLGAVRSISSLEPLLAIPALEVLHLCNKVGIARTEIERLKSHPELNSLAWFNPDEPKWTWEAVRELGLPQARAVRIEDPDWLP